MTLEELLGNRYTLLQVYGLGPDVITAKTDPTPTAWAVTLEDNEAPDGEYHYASGPDIVTAASYAINKAQQAEASRARETAET